MSSDRFIARCSVTDNSLYPTKYALTGEQSTRQSTAKVRKSALHQLNIFVKSLKIDAEDFTERNPELDVVSYHTAELESAFCSKVFWMQYATFLVDYATKQNKSEAFSPTTAYNYIGIAKERIRLIYPNNRIWIGHENCTGNNSSSDGWFSNIKNSVKDILTTRRQESGLFVGEQTLPIGILTQLLFINIQIYLSYMYVIGRAVLADCIGYLLSLNTPIGVEKSIALAITLSAIGRGGEAGWIVYELGHWDYTNDVLYLMWNDIKTKRQLPMNFYHDYSDYRLCIYFLMFLYFMVGAGHSYTLSASFMEEKTKRKLKDSTLLFPFLISGATEKISGYLHECVGKVKNLRPGRMNVTARSLRYGGLQETAVSGQIDAGTHRGGWCDNSPKNSHTYMQGNWELRAIGAKAVSGYPNPKGRVHPPSCEAFLRSFNQTDRQEFQNFLSSFMKGSYDIASEDSPLQPFVYAMFASFLRWMPDFFGIYTDTHCSMNHLRNSMTKFKYKREDLDHWSRAVCADFNLKNAVITSDGSSVPGWAEQLLQRHILLEESIRKLMRENEELKSVVHETNLLVKSKADSNMCSTHHSSPRKRRSMEPSDSSNTLPRASQGEPDSNKSMSSTINNSGNCSAFGELMNPRKQPSNEYSKEIKSSTEVIDTQFITNLYDYDMRFVVSISATKQVKSKIDEVIKDFIIPMMKSVSLSTSWPSKSRQPEKCDIQWRTWESDRSKIADDVVKRIHVTFKDKIKTTFIPTISAIYCKLHPPASTSKKIRK